MRLGDGWGRILLQRGATTIQRDRFRRLTCHRRVEGSLRSVLATGGENASQRLFHDVQRITGKHVCSSPSATTTTTTWWERRGSSGHELEGSHGRFRLGGHSCKSTCVFFVLSHDEQRFADQFVDSVIFGRSIKNEYLTLGTLFTVGATVFAVRSGKKDTVAAGRPLAERVKDAVPMKAESSEEEELINSIKNFIAEAEKESGGVTGSLQQRRSPLRRPISFTETTLQVHLFMTTFIMSLPSPPDPPTPPPALPSPPTSPTSPKAATTTRTRIMASRRPGSPGDTTSSEGHEERTRSTSPSLSRVASADPDTADSENRTVARPSASVAVGKRRKPSIAYYTPSSPSPWSQRPQSNRTLSSGVDSPRDGEPVMSNGRENVSQRSSVVLGSRSPSTRESVCSSDGVGVREREPLTMVEKHADLLHFIAQKERKCLELRDQLAAHETELAELKRKWERIVNRGHEPLPNLPLAAGLGGVAFDGLKEGVRLIAAGFGDIGGTIQELESTDKNTSKPISFIHPPHENNHRSIARAKRTGSEHLSTSSMSSIQECLHASDHGLEGEEVETMATTPFLSRTGSLSCRMHKRGSRIIAKEPTTPTSAFVSPPTQKPKPANLDMDMSLILPPSPTLVPLLSASATPASARPAPNPPVFGSADEPVPMTAEPVLSWMDNVGRKLSGLQKGQTFSKNKKRASLLLAGVSDTITAALSPGPTATTPAPAPTSTSTSPSTTTPRILASTIPCSTSPVSTKSSSTTLPPSSKPESQSQPYPSYKSMTDWLDDEDEEQQMVHADAVLLIPDSKQQSRAPVSVHTTDVGIVRGEGAATATVASSFDDDDDWNW
ncbi:hypothetical protein J3R82DRAFT_6748 [Butyriboletus roseoflavus]|nr:hypothetical protein J3R82DRAFT_6748 [Butyriboletus roseoflavus]